MTMADAHTGSHEQPDYRSYLLRLWRVEGGRHAAWRASLRRVSSGEQVGFASLEELFDYLRAQTTQESERPTS
jgi:hypothetical protein